ncbi:LOW QUALITY PROTEIN: zinc finger protein 862-like [Branchiostoma floridae x Branchiostoma belcheri]
MRRKLVEKVRNSEWLSILTDGSTDRGRIEEEVVLVRYLLDNAEPVTTFVALKSLHRGDAANITEAIKEVLERDLDLQEETWTKKLPAVCMDGAAVNFGCRVGVVTRLQEKVPSLIPIHCCAHRLELVVKDILKRVPYFQVVEDLLMSLYRFYHWSPLNWDELKRMGEAFNIVILKPPKASGTRWLPHHERAVVAVTRDFPAFVKHLGEVATQATGERKLKAAGLQGHKNLEVCFLLKLSKSLHSMSGLSHLFQVNDSTVEMVATKVQALVTHFTKLQTDEQKMSSILHTDLVINDEEGVEQATWFETPLVVKSTLRHSPSTSAGVMEESMKMHKKLGETIGKLGERFDSYIANPVLKAANCFDMGNWPSEDDDDDDMEDFGASQVEAIYKHYKRIMDMKGFSLETAQAEWTELQVVLKRKYPNRNKKFIKLWPSVLRSFQDTGRFDNIFSIIMLLLIFPIHTAECERTFSHMNYVKTDWRSRLQSSALTSLPMIKLSPTTLEAFDPTNSISLWYDGGKRRPATQP